MSKAIRLLIICIIAAVLLAATADAADTEEQTSAAEAVAVAEPTPEPEAESDPMAPVDAPASEPAGTVYAVGNSGTAALTVVDYTDEGADAGVQFNGESRYYYGAQITGADYGAVIDGAVSGYFGSSGGSIPLYDAKGAVCGIVWGACRPTAVDCGVGFLLSGDVTGTILVEDGAGFTCREAVILCPTGSGSFRFHNARLSSETGELLQMESGAGDVAVTYENGSYSGKLINESGSALTVAVGHGALLFGDTVQTDGPIEVSVAAGAVWAVEQSAGITCLTVEDGATVYGTLEENEDGSLTLLASDSVLEPGTYEATPLAEELPLGHGPAAPAEEASDTDAEETSAPEQDVGTESKLFPLAPTPSPAVSSKDVEAPEPTPEAEPETKNASDANAAADKNSSNYDKRMFPLAPAATEPADAPEESASEPSGKSQPEVAGNAPEQDAPASAIPEIEQATMRRSLLLGAGLARPSALGASVGTVTSSMELAALLAARTTGQPPAASLLKTGAKTHSFLPQTLDNRAIILYNPYCCSAA